MDKADPRANLEPFQALIGEWTIEMTHPMVEDTVVPGLGLRPPGRGAGPTPPLSAHDARLDETMGGWKDVEAGRLRSNS